MAKRKQPSHRPQAKHKKNRSSSQFDKRERLDRTNPRRKKTTKAKVPLVGPMLAHVKSMARMLDARMAFRLSIIMAGMMLGDDRRVASAWFAAGGVKRDGYAFTAKYEATIKGDYATGTLFFSSDQGSGDVPWEAKRTLALADMVGSWKMELKTPEGEVHELGRCLGLYEVAFQAGEQDLHTDRLVRTSLAPVTNIDVSLSWPPREVSRRIGPLKNERNVLGSAKPICPCSPLSSTTASNAHWFNRRSAEGPSVTIEIANPSWVRNSRILSAKSDSPIASSTWCGMMALRCEDQAWLTNAITEPNYRVSVEGCHGCLGNST